MIIKEVDLGLDTLGVRWWCPGCGDHHVVPYTGENAWDWNQSLTEPTLNPSILVLSRNKLINEDLPSDKLLSASNITTTPQCHSFMKDGNLIFLGDSTHYLAGKSVEMVNIDGI